MNDVSEEELLNRYLFGQTHSNNTKRKSFIHNPFIASFVPKEKDNELTLWHAYAKEDKNEAVSCSISIDRKNVLKRLKSQNCSLNKEIT